MFGLVVFVESFVEQDLVTAFAVDNPFHFSTKWYRRFHLSGDYLALV